ncbi:hypothetical protein [Xylanimonas oleitrophica]|uniref:hypothetical protein n=1 Tax=Xylanimonas oleitrophica TaxID=2607479 RepID=UPI0015D0B193|nr:hypothetical protein [Xylanimonas oleitrophica]
MIPSRVLDPMPGEPGVLGEAAGRTEQRAWALDDVRHRLLAVHGWLDGEVSSAVDGARARIAETAEGAATAARVLGAVAGLLRRHGDTLASLQVAAAQAARRHEEAVARARRWDAEVRSLEARRRFLCTAVGPAAVTVEPDVELARQLGVAQHQRREALDDAARAEAQWRAAHDELRGAASRAAAEAVALGDTGAVRAWVLAAPHLSPGAGGLGRGAAAGADAAGLAAFAAAQAAGRSAARALAGAAPSAADVEQAHDLLQPLVRAHGDAVFWAAFWAQAAPADVYRSLAAAFPLPELRGEGMGTVPPAWAAVTAALAAGARAWGAAQGRAEHEAFGRRLVADLGAAGPPGAPGRGAAVLAAATVLRGLSVPDDGTTAGGHGGGAPPRHGAAAATGALLALEELVLPELEHRSVHDRPTAVLATAAFEGLATDPAAVFAYLAPADDDALARRTRLWLGTAPGFPQGGWPDGGVAVATVLGTAVAVGAGSPARADQARAAALVTRATAAMPHGLLSGPPLAPDAERRVAQVYRPYVGVFGDAARDGVGGPHAPAGAGLAEVPGGPVQPTLGAFDLREVVAATSRTSLGGAAWLAAAEDHQEAVLGWAFPVVPLGPPTPGAPDVPERADPGLDRADREAVARELLADVGTVAGAISVDTVRAAELADARNQALVDAAAVGVGVAASAVTVGSSAVTGLALSAAAGAGTAGASAVVKEMLPDHAAAARADVSVEGGALHDRFATTTHSRALAWSQQQGATAAEARAEWARLPDDGCASFEQTFRPMSEVGHELGGPVCEEDRGQEDGRDRKRR